MELLDKNDINIDKVIKRKLGILKHHNQVKIESALQKIIVDPSQFIRKSFGDPQIKAYKTDPFANEHKKPFKIQENENIRKVLNNYTQEYEKNFDSYVEHKLENDKFHKKYWQGKFIQAPEKLKQKDNEILKDIFLGYDKKGYKQEKLKNVGRIFKQSPLLLNERGIQRYYNENRSFKGDESNDKDFVFMEKLNIQINFVMQKNKKEESLKNDYFASDKYNKMKNRSVDLYDGIPTDKIYKQLILNELHNYELKQALNDVITEESESEQVGIDRRLNSKESKKSYVFNNNNNNNKNKFTETISIRENLAVDTIPSIFRSDKDYFNNNNVTNSIKKTNNSMNLNISKIDNQNTDNNGISQYNNDRTENKNKQFLKGKSIFGRNGETISNFDANNTKRTEVTTINNDFKIFRQSGFIINSDFVKKDETKYNGLPTKKYVELENFYDKASKKDVLKEEILNYFNDNPKRGFVYDENKKIEPSDILKSIKDIKKKINDNDVELMIGPIMDKVANYSIDPEEIIKIKKLDDKFSTLEMNLIKNLNKIKK